MNVHPMRLYCRNISFSICFEIFHPHLISRVGKLVMRHLIQKSIVNNRNGKMSMYTFRNPTHFRMTMPIKFLPLGYNHIKQCKFLFPFDGQSNNTMRLFDLTHYFIDFWYFEFIHLFDQKTKMWRFDEGFGIEVIMFRRDATDQIQYVFQGMVLIQDYLKLFKFLGLQHRLLTL